MGQSVSEQGYADTTIADVVRIARTSRTAFYKHFADKEECFLATYQQMTNVRIAASLDAAAQCETWDEKLDAGIAAYFRWMAEHPEVAVTTVVEVHCAGPRALDARSDALGGWTKTIEGVAVLARQAGVEVEIDPTRVLRRDRHRRGLRSRVRADGAARRGRRADSRRAGARALAVHCGLDRVARSRGGRAPPRELRPRPSSGCLHSRVWDTVSRADARNRKDADRVGAARRASRSSAGRREDRVAPTDCDHARASPPRARSRVDHRRCRSK